MTEIKEVVKRLEAYLKPISPEEAVGRVSRMEAIQSQSVSKTNLDNSLRELAQLKVILTKINDPDYGRCQECDEFISQKRLMLFPYIAKCLRCIEK